MFNKKLFFALIILIIAVSSVSAADFNSTDCVNGDDSNLDAVSENVSNVLVSDSNETSWLGETDSDALASEGQTVYFDASASTDGSGTKARPYKYFRSGRITSGMTAYFADGVYDMSFSSTFTSSLYDVKFIGQSRENTIIRSTSTYRFNVYANSNVNLIINDLTLQDVHIKNYANMKATNVNFVNTKGSTTSTSTGFYYSGGAIQCDYSSGSYPTLTLNNCYFENYNAASGGAISAKNSNVIITSCIFYNTTSNVFGGAIYSLNSSVSISNSVFRKSNSKYGGVIYCENKALTLTDSNFTTSESYSFGGVIASKLCGIASSNCIFLDYKSSTDSGGAIYSERGSVYVSKSSFTNGRADYGGAICILNENLKIFDSNFQNNTAVYGGSIFTMYKTVYVYNTEFRSSTAQYGTAICSYLPDSVTLTNNVFVNANNVYIFAKSATKFTKSGNSGLTNVQLINTTVFDVASNSEVPVISYSPQSQGSIPSSYDSRDYGYVTPVKNQLSGGTCWAFAAIATLETCLKKATGITYDFSEENVKNLVKVYSLFGRGYEPNTGANDRELFAYFINWLGPIYDSLETYDDHSALSDIYNPLFHIQNIYCLPTRQNTNDNDLIKRAIMDYGAVVASLYWTSAYHAISIIGWDDNFNAKDAFGNYTKGAWIVKNSWGENSGDCGFYYVSYERQLMSEKFNSEYVYTFVFNDTEAYTRNYQYDVAGVTFLHETFKDVVSYKNIFVAKDNELLSAVSTFFHVSTKYSVSVYVGSQLVLTQSGYSSAGYHTIALNSKITLSKGDSFTIVITNLNSGIKYIPMCRADQNIGSLPSGVSYINFGDGWNDLYSYYGSNRVACIKAFTTPLSLNEVTLSVNTISTLNVNEYVLFNFKLSNTKLNGGFITLQINENTYYLPVSNGHASLKLNFDTVGNYNFAAQYKSNLYVSNKFSFNFKVVNPSSTISVSAPDLVKYYGSSTRFAIRVTQGGQPLSGVAVKYTRGTSTLTATTNSNGYAYIGINLYPGTYQVTSEYGGVSVKSTITVKSTIFASDLTYDYGNSYLKATFYNTAGGVLSNTQVKFKVDGLDVYATTTNSYGLASYYIKLDSNTYLITATNPVNNETKTFVLRISKVTPVLTLKQIKLNGVDYLRATLSQTAATGKIIFTVNGKDYSSTISEGISNFKLSQFSGTFTVSVRYSGDSNFNDVNGSTSVKLEEYVTTIYVNDLVKYYGDSRVLTITVRDNNGKPVANNWVTITIYDGEDEWFWEYELKTNSLGQIKLKCNFVPDTYSMDIENDDDLIFVDVEVRKLNPKLFAVNRAVKAKTKVKTYAVILKNNKNQVIRNAKVTLKVNGVTYVAKTNAYGKAIFKITKLNRKGNFNAVVNYAGNAYFNRVYKIVRFYVR